MKAPFLPNSQFTQLPWDCLHPNHAGYNAIGTAIDITPFAPGSSLIGTILFAKCRYAGA